MRQSDPYGRRCRVWGNAWGNSSLTSTTDAHDGDRLSEHHAAGRNERRKDERRDDRVYRCRDHGDVHGVDQSSRPSTCGWQPGTFDCTA